MTCDCGYSTPTTKWDGQPLSDARQRFVFRRHRCAPNRDEHGRPITETVCVDCGETRWVRRPRGDRCERCARKNPWHAWFDEMAVDRLLAGNPPPRTSRAERQAAVIYLSNRGLPANVIAERIHVSTRTVVRLRNRQPHE